MDLPGLLTDDMGDGLLDYQRPYARPAAEVAGWATPVQVDPSTLPLAADGRAAPGPGRLWHHHPRRP